MYCGLNVEIDPYLAIEEIEISHPRILSATLWILTAKIVEHGDYASPCD